MTRRTAVLALLALVGWLTAAGACAAAAEADAPTDEDGQHILVMLRLAPPHYRPGYGATAGQGGGDWHQASRRFAARIAREAGLVMEDEWPMPVIGIDCVTMTVPQGQSADAAMARVSRIAGVAWAQPMHVFQGQGAPVDHNDSLFRAQPSATQWRLPYLHRLATGRGVNVAVIDSRIDASHPDLRGQVRLLEDFAGGSGTAPEMHGTGVAGIIAARADNRIGIAGVAPDARLLGLRACREQPGSPAAAICDTLALARAINFAIEHDADVINLSLSGPEDRLLLRLVEVGIARGSTVVAAFDTRRPDGGFPASAPGVIAVADEALAAPRSGVYIAPGIDVPTTEPGGRWDLVSGNSFAAANVSGLLAVLRQLKPADGPTGWLAASRRADGRIDICETLRRIGRVHEGGCDPMP